MAISNVINQTPASAPATASAPAPAPASAAATQPTANTGKAKTDAQKLRSEFISTGSAAKASMTEEERAQLGSRSDDITFICCLGDPTKPVKRVEGGNKNIDSLTVIGWKFRANADITVPVAPYKSDSNSAMAVEPATTKVVKAGEEFSLNLAETAMLLSEPQYCGCVSGDGKKVVMNVTVTPSSKEPKPQLNASAQQGSVKGNLISVADVAKGADGRIQSITVKPEFAAFQSYFDRRKNRKVDGQPKPNKEANKQQDVALAFRAFFKSKG